MGKSIQPFLQEVAEDMYRRFGHDLQQCTIVFNNKRPAVYLQKYFAEIIKKPFFSPAFMTIQEFYGATSSLKIADFYKQFFTLFKVYNQLLAEERQAPVSSHRFFQLGKVILSDFSQIDNDLVDAVLLYRDLEDISVINKEFDFLSTEQYAFLSQFWASYTEGKHKKQQELFIKMWRRMPKLYHLFHSSLELEGFMTNGMAYRKLVDSGNIVSKIMEAYPDGPIAFVGFNALNKSEAKVFSALQDTEKALFYFDADPYYLEDELQEAGLFMRKNLGQLGLKNSLDSSRSFLRNFEHKVDVYKVQGSTVQAKVLSSILKPAYASEESTVVILADERLLLPTLQTIPTAVDGANVELNVTMGFSLATSSLYGFIELWLDTQAELLKSNKISYHLVVSFLSHPLSGLSQKMREKVQTALIKEKHVYIEAERLIQQKGLFEIFFKKTEASKFVFSHLLELLDMVLNRQYSNGSLKKMDAELFVKTIQEVNRLEDTLSQYIEKEETSFVFYLVQKALQSVSVPLSGDPLTGIQVMGLLESRNLNFDNVIILGFNEGIIPKTSLGTSFIPDSLRRVYGLPVLENLDAISSYMVYRLIQRAKQVHLVYNNLTDDSTSGEVSRILKQLAYESGFEIKHHELNLDVKTEPQKNIVIQKEGNAAVKASLQRYLNKSKTLSPSAITTYIYNPVDFFFKYIADIKEPEEVKLELEPREVGSILHRVMEDFYQGCERMEITGEWIKQRMKAIPALLKQGFNKVMYGKVQADAALEGMQEVFIAIVAQYVDIILKHDIQQAPFTLLSLEQKVSAEISFPVHGVESSIKLFGVIDRVDKKDGVIRIVDYKTGSDELKFSGIEDLFNTHKKSANKAVVQTLLYAYMYEQSLKTEGVEPQLFVMKHMRNLGVKFQYQKEPLEGAALTAVKQEFLEAMRQKLTELFEAPTFEVSNEAQNYTYSIYKELYGKA